LRPGGLEEPGQIPETKNLKKERFRKPNRVVNSKTKSLRNGGTIAGVKIWGLTQAAPPIVGLHGFPTRVQTQRGPRSKNHKPEHNFHDDQ